MLFSKYDLQHFILTDREILYPISHIAIQKILAHLLFCSLMFGCVVASIVLSFIKLYTSALLTWKAKPSSSMHSFSNGRVTLMTSLFDSFVMFSTPMDKAVGDNFHHGVSAKFKSKLLNSSWLKTNWKRDYVECLKYVNDVKPYQYFASLHLDCHCTRLLFHDFETFWALKLMFSVKNIEYDHKFPLCIKNILMIHSFEFLIGSLDL